MRNRLLIKLICTFNIIAPQLSNAADSITTTADPVIESIRAGCAVKKCPKDEIQIFSDGTLRYRELKFELNTELDWKYKQLSPQQLAHLLAQFKAVGFEKLRETRKYRNELADERQICSTPTIGVRGCGLTEEYSLVMKRRGTFVKINPFLVEKRLSGRLLDLQISIGKLIETPQ